MPIFKFRLFCSAKDFSQTTKAIKKIFQQSIVPIKFLFHAEYSVCWLMRRCSIPFSKKTKLHIFFSKGVIFYLNFRENCIIMYPVRQCVCCQCTVEYVTGVFSASYILFLERYLISNLAKSAKIAKAYLKDKLGFRGQEVSRNFLLRNSPRRSQEVISRFSP